jgi:hypothetical protein
MRPVVPKKVCDAINGCRSMKGSMSKNKLSSKLLNFSVPHEANEEEIESWWRRVYESNHELVNVLRRIRETHRALLEGRPRRDNEEVLALVEVALRNAAEANPWPLLSAPVVSHSTKRRQQEALSG